MRPQRIPSSWRDFHGFTRHAEYFFRFLDLCRTPNGVCGVKLMWLQFLAWESDARRYLRSGTSTQSLFRGMTGQLHVVRLVRRDTLRQAISWVRAQQTGVWSRHRTEHVRASNQTLSYDPVVLKEAVDRLNHQNSSWEEVLSQWRVPKLVIVYEELATEYTATIARVLEFLGLPVGRVSRELPVLAKQSDEITEEWVARALCDLG